jgi:transposase
MAAESDEGLSALGRAEVDGPPGVLGVSASHATTGQVRDYRRATSPMGRDLPAEFGAWQTVWKRHRRYASDGTWDRIHAKLLAEADAAGQIDWTVSVDSTINRAHQHGTNLPRATGGTPELQETAC